jgi:hypothetical protein
MNKKIILVIVAVIVLGLGGFLVYSKVLKPAGITPENSSTSLKALITKGIPQTCTYDIGGTSGTIYVSGQKMRGDFEAKDEEKTVKSHMIVDGDTSYMWTEGQPTGYKIVAEKEEGTTSEAGTSQTGPIDVNQDYNYICKPWVVNNSVFNLPAGINFMNFGEMSNPSGGSMPAQCSVCNSLTGDEKTQCLVSLNCN